MKTKTTIFSQNIVKKIEKRYNLIGEIMYQIKNETNDELIIKNSKFISYIFKVNNENEINEKIEEAKQIHKDYTHLVYAYKLENKQKQVDDKEPTGTAGAPILEVINKNDLVNVLIIVIRYFGGIKLGAGGLIRAYSKSARILLQNLEKEEYIKYNNYILETEYDNKDLLNILTKDLIIEKKEFNETIKYKIKIKDEEDNLQEKLKNTKIKVKKI